MDSNSTSAAGAPHVVCLGGGYVAIYLAKALRPHLRAGRVRLTVIDRDNFQCFHGLIPEMVTGKIQPTDTLSPARRLFAPGDFVNAEVEEIDLASKQILVSRLLDGRQLTIPYDHVVIGLGNSENLERYPGLAEHSFRLKAYSGCLAVRNHVINMLELADMEKDPEERRRLLTFTVVGGGFAGVEVAGELRDFLPTVAKKHFPHVPLSEIRIVQIVPTDHILPELNTHQPALVRYAQQVLAKDPHLEIRYGRTMASATMEEAVLDNGERIPTRTIISCAGMAALPIVERLPVKKDRGRIVTDAYGHIDGYEDAWAGGDCAAVPLQKGGYAPGLAIWAMTVGELIGKNIVRQTEGKPLKLYRFSGLGDACVLGHRRAVAHLKGIPLRGFLAWVIWRIFMILYLPSPEKKVRVLGNWMMAPFFGHDLVNMRVHQPVDLAPLVFEPGQDIVRKGDIGNSLFVIQEGEVDVLDPDAPGDGRLAVLGEGAHFGEIAVFERRPRTATVRARTRVKVLQVRREAAIALSETIEIVGRTLRAGPGARAEVAASPAAGVTD
jgi:NADH dehydrogenase